MGALDVKSFRELTVWREAVELVVTAIVSPASAGAVRLVADEAATSIPATSPKGTATAQAS